MSGHPELTLLVHHDVKIKGYIRHLRYHINMVEVASKVVGSYGTLDTNAHSKDVLSVDERSLKVIIVIAIALRKLVASSLKDMKEGQPVPWISNTTKSNKAAPKTQNTQISSPADFENLYQFPEVDGISIDQFQPARLKQKEILGPMLLNLKEEEFEMKNEPMSSQEFGTDDDRTLDKSLDSGNSSVQLNKNAITADKLNGIFSF